MPEQQATVIPFGKHRGRAIQAVDSPYLRWCLRDCANLDDRLRAAIEVELRRRDDIGLSREDRRDLRADQLTPAPVRTGPPLIDRPAVFTLLADVLAAAVRVRVVARGDGAVHVYGVERLAPSLRARLALRHAAIDSLARWVRFDDTGGLRATRAAEILGRLRSRGVVVTANPDGGVVASPKGTEAVTAADAMEGLTPGERRELWFRIAVNLPDDAAAPSPTRCQVPLNSLAGLHRYCETRIAKSRGDQIVRWRAFADAVAALRAGQSVSEAMVVALVIHCRREMDRAERRGQVPAARRWKMWTMALGVRCS